ncbi:glycosyltransferase family 2 protein [Methylacidimicrobium sp. B4]|uniref:glycosyltransferase family 2 protein n=1 Tax=Methylacidimicrobium sp. B4 TaxID=2796139 RepID=UPI001A8DC770|nr:glycosyltransferase family 2 protein [Methylacidimicrobium sp. B4]QSR85854.1 glycosyltransferase family 2 protein [Methylacidimicrobium sp. B4]
MTGHSPQGPTVSVIVPCYNESENLPALYARMRDVMDSSHEEWEMICVNDGSTDETLDRLIQLYQEDPRVVVIDLSRNFGKEAALTAGLAHARGQCAIPLDADLQDPPEIIPRMLAKWREGFDVVNAVRISRKGESWLKKISSYAFYRAINCMSIVEIPPNTGDLRLLSRPTLDALKALPERRRFMKGLFAWLGFRTASVYYHREPRHAGRSKWSYQKLWQFALDGITSFSQVPLRFASYLGFVVSGLASFSAIYLVARTLLKGSPVKGYPSIMVTLLFLGGVQLMALGVIGEYLGRTYEECKQRPIYLVRRIWSHKDVDEA